MRRFRDFGRLPPGDRAPAIMWAARRHLAALDDPSASPARISANRRALRRLAALATRYAVTLPLAVTAEASPFSRRAADRPCQRHIPNQERMMTMDRSEEAKVQAQILSRTLENVGRKLMVEKAMTAEQVGLALSAASLTFLHEAWTSEQIVAHLAGLTQAIGDVHGINPATGQEVARGRAN